MEVTDSRVTFGVSKMDFNTSETKKAFNKEEYKLMTDMQYTKVVNEYIDAIMLKK